MTNDLLQAALSYAARGWHVFPLVPKGKMPLTTNGFKDATTDEVRIRDWWTWHPTANIGIATGAVSGLVVLDFDKKSGGLDTLLYLSATLPYTYAVETQGGGSHFYFTHPGGVVRNRAGLLKGMDVRGDGGYVVAGGSAGYVVCAGPNGIPSPAPLSAALLDLLTGTPQPLRPASQAPLAEGVKGDLAKATLKFILFGAEPGTWHALLFKAAMDLKQNGYDLEESIEKLESSGLVMDATHDLPLLMDVAANRTPKHPPRQAAPEPASYDYIEPAGDDEPELARPAAPSLNAPVATFLEGMFKALSDPNKIKGTSTGIEGIDGMLGGGKRFGELTVTMALAKTGKSSLYAYYIHQLLKQGHPVGYASREMRPDSEVVPNLLSIEHGESVLDLAIKGKITAAHRERYRASVASWPLHFAAGYGPFPLDSFISWVRELKILGVKWFFIDHLHYCLATEEDWSEAVTLVRHLKTLTIEEEIHIDLIVQPTKLGEGMRLGLNSLKGGSGIGQALDNLFFLEPTETPNIRKLTLDRARFPLASPGEIFLQYDKMARTFTQVEPVAEPAPPTHSGSLPQPNRFSGYRLDG